MNNTSKSARLVTVTMTARVIVNEDATEEQTIAAAQDKFRLLVEESYGSHIVAVQPDTERPFDAWVDFEELEALQKKGKKKRQSTRSAAVDEWIKDWINLWPKIKQESTGKYLSADADVITQKMKWFVDHYPYERQWIFDATKAYLLHQYKQHWQHVRRASNFIYWQEPGRNRIRQSDMAAWCEGIGEVEMPYETRLTRHIN